jgi:hypothetical protein
MLTMALLLGAPGVAGAGQSYTIISEDATQTSRVVAVRIEERLSEEALQRVALEVRDRAAGSQVRHTQVSFFLPRMPTASRPWASVDTSPTPKIRVFGLSLAEEARLAAEAAADPRKPIGSYIVDLPASPGRITLFASKGRTYAEWAQRGGARITDEVTVERDGSGTRYAPKSGAADHYLVKPNGTLEVRNESTLVAVAEPAARAARHGADVAAAPGQALEQTAHEAPSTAPVAPATRPNRATRRVASARKASGPNLFYSDYMKPIATR